MERQQSSICDFSNKMNKTSNNPIEHVDSFEHLGHVITNQLTDNADILKRKSDFVAKSDNVLCFFSKLSSLIKYKLCHSHRIRRQLDSFGSYPL